MIRVALPFHLRSLANVEREVNLQLGGTPTIAAVLDELKHSTLYAARNHSRPCHQAAPPVHSLLCLWTGFFS